VLWGGGIQCQRAGHDPRRLPRCHPRSKGEKIQLLQAIAYIYIHKYIQDSCRVMQGSSMSPSRQRWASWTQDAWLPSLSKTVICIHYICIYISRIDTYVNTWGPVVWWGRMSDRLDTQGGGEANAATLLGTKECTYIFTYLHAYQYVYVRWLVAWWRCMSTPKTVFSW
jgi:hypothetical protein